MARALQQFEKPKLYLDQGDYDARFNPEQRVTTLLLRAEQSSLQQVLALKRDIETAVARSDLVMSHAERMQIICDHLNIILSTLLLLSFLVLVVSAIGNASAVGISILERTRELGILRAIGATPQTIARLLRAEGILVSLLGISLGLLLSAHTPPVPAMGNIVASITLDTTASGVCGDTVFEVDGRSEKFTGVKRPVSGYLWQCTYSGTLFNVSAGSGQDSSWKMGTQGLNFRSPRGVERCRCRGAAPQQMPRQISDEHVDVDAWVGRRVFNPTAATCATTDVQTEPAPVQEQLRQRRGVLDWQPVPQRQLLRRQMHCCHGSAHLQRLRVRCRAR